LSASIQLFHTLGKISTTEKSFEGTMIKQVGLISRKGKISIPRRDRYKSTFPLKVLESHGHAGEISASGGDAKKKEKALEGAQTLPQKVTSLNAFFFLGIVPLFIKSLGFTAQDREIFTLQGGQ
jgi:hypothetical protein